MGSSAAVGALPEEREEASAPLGMTPAAWRGALVGLPGYLAVFRGPDHVLVFQNAACLEAFGARALGEPLRSILPEHRERLVPLLDRVLQTGEPFEAAAVSTLAARPAAEAWVDLSCRPLRNEAGAVEFVMVHGSDATARVKAFRQQADRRVELLRTLSHELRSPLSTLLMQAQMLQRSVPETDPGRRRVDMIVAKAQRIEQTLRELVDGARQD
jgi:nitrogen-specific signal transduction histidine kinase